MSETDQKTPSKTICLDKNEFEGTAEALTFYMNAYSAHSDDSHGQDAIRKFIQSTSDHGFMWVHIWFGRNHQRIKAGDTVRQWSPNDEPEFLEAEVLDVTSFAAFLLSENGAEWLPWPMVHRMDRLHTEPDFDATHWVPCSRHMGYDVNPDAAVEYDAIVAKRTHLTLVTNDQSGDAPVTKTIDDGGMA